jgi:hypothetical protein
VADWISSYLRRASTKTWCDIAKTQGLIRCTMTALVGTQTQNQKQEIFKEDNQSGGLPPFLQLYRQYHRQP